MIRSFMQANPGGTLGPFWEQCVENRNPEVPNGPLFVSRWTFKN